MFVQIVILLWVLGLASCGGLQFGERRAPEKVEPAASGAEPREASGPTVDVTWRHFGVSVEGRPLRVRTLGTGARRVLWIGGIHGNEVEGALATAELPAAFLAEPGLADRVQLTIIEDVNPDGRAHRTRRNARGVDLNRNYPATNYRAGADRGSKALCEPEAQALHDLLLELRPELVLVAHSWGRRATGPRAFVNFDGPAAAIAERFAARSGFPVVPSDDIHGTPGSLGSFVGIDLGIPILTIEYAGGDDQRKCWEATRSAILAVVRGD